VIAYPASLPNFSSLTFESFNLDANALDSPLPGVNVLPQAQMLFVDANVHFIEASKLIAIICPECKAKCRSDKALHQHVKEKHKKQFCHLCYDHRSLFTCEMRLMTPAQIQAHMEASVASTENQGKTSRKVKKRFEEVAAGHQLCRFCSTYFYDSHGLYVHMRDDHFQCHFCPVGNNHRFYRDLNDLLKHLRSTHFLCSMCLNSQLATNHSVTDAGIVAFKRQSEFAEVI
jgi:hypothetical protein